MGDVAVASLGHELDLAFNLAPNGVRVAAQGDRAEVPHEGDPVAELGRQLPDVQSRRHLQRLETVDAGLDEQRDGLGAVPVAVVNDLETVFLLEVFDDGLVARHQ